MKVERKTAAPAFVPIVITLETEEEASHLWHKLDSNFDWKSYCEARCIPHNSEFNGLNTMMWSALSEVFCPIGYMPY